MKPVKLYKDKSLGISTDALSVVAEKHEAINKAIETGNSIDPELSKNFVSFPLSDNPYKD